MANIERYEIERIESWREWAYKIPAIKFDAEWGVKVIPPCGGAMVRFVVEHNGNKASVYLDVNDSLGCVGKPYWEVYPVENDNVRCGIDDTETLLSFIRKSLSATNQEQP